MKNNDFDPTSLRLELCNAYAMNRLLKIIHPEITSIEREVLVDQIKLAHIEYQGILDSRI